MAEAGRWRGINVASVTAYLGLGSNLGDRFNNLRMGYRLLRLPQRLFPPHSRLSRPRTTKLPRKRESTPNGVLTHLRSSPVYETAPWGIPEQPDFLNCVLEVQTTLSPQDLLRWVKQVEAAMGRQEGPRFGPRNIDVDIILYGSMTIKETDLQVPHIGMHERAFVLVPLSDLAPRLIHPTLGRTIEDLVTTVAEPEGVRRWGPPLTA